jgi:SAM-dependent methyltransferase
VTRASRFAAPSFARSANAYERARPGYAPEAVAALVERLDLGSGSVVVDLAAGTGKLARQLVPSGARIVAVEPLAEMRSLVPAGIEVLAGTAEAIPLPHDFAHAVTVAQAFHWFDAEAALREIERVLRSRGLLALISNRREPSAFDEMLARHRTHPPLEPPPAGEAFPHVHRANLAELAATESSIATLKGHAYDTAIAEFAALGTQELRYVTYLQIGKARDLVATRSRDVRDGRSRRHGATGERPTG